MDVLFFLKDRTRLIGQYYDLAVQPFEAIIAKIEAQAEPYVPPYSEDAEPAFLSEWIEASEMIEITGRTCISMLSASLQLYFKSWERELNLKCAECIKGVFKKGLVAGYRTCFEETLDIDWSSCPADLDIIEQVVLARNRDQHPENITSIRVSHTDVDWQRYSMPFFVSDREAELFKDDYDNSWLMSPSLHVSRDKLNIAINQVESLCEWLESKMFDAKYSGRSS